MEAFPFRRASWGCYRIIGRISSRLFLCRDFEGSFEKPAAEVWRDEIITQAEYLNAEKERFDARFEANLKIWESDIRNLQLAN